MHAAIHDIIEPWRSDLQRSGQTYYLVGGAVRDLALKRPVTDLDLVCRNAPAAAERLAQNSHLRVVAFGKRPDQRAYRVICLDDPTRYLDITTQHGTTIADDLKDRDFTINAMAAEISNDLEPRVIDPLNGMRDLQKKTIRMVHPAAFEMDPLRILRAFRLAAELGFTLEAQTRAAARRCAAVLSTCAGERIWSELLQILECPHSAEWVVKLDAAGALQAVLPEIEAMKRCTQNAHHHLDVWRHSLLVLENCERIFKHLPEEFGAAAGYVEDYLGDGRHAALIKLTALLHDVAKPSARDVSAPEGRITFYDHDRIGAVMVANITRRLRLSGRQSRLVTTLVAEHLHLLFLAEPQVLPATRMRLFRKLGKDTIALLILGMADLRATRGPAASYDKRHNFCRWVRETIVNLQTTILPRAQQAPLITGHDLIGLGMSPGPALGAILAQINKARDNDQVTTRADALALARKLLSPK